jgi:hypothetical protein
VTGKELKQLRLADRASRKAIACRTSWTAARVEQIELKPFVRDSTVRLYLRALDGVVRFREATVARKAARREGSVLPTKAA